MSLLAGRPSRATKAVTLADMSDSKSTVRVNFDLDRESHTQLKIYALKQGKSVKQVLTELIETLK